MRFHHMGIIARDIDREAAVYADLGYAPEGEAFEDAGQGIRGLFIAGGGPRLELLAPLGDSDTLEPFIRRGVKCYHHGYEVDSVADATQTLLGRRARVVRAPMESVAFGGRLITFLMLPNMWMVELIEAAA